MRGSQTVTSPLTGQVTYGEAVIHYGSARARLGYAFQHFLLYGTGGLAWTYSQATRDQVTGFPVGGFATPGTVDTKLLWRLGWAAGAGIEIPLTGNWTAKAEYLSTGFGRKGVTFPAAAEVFASDLAMQSVRLGVNYRIGGDDAHISDFLAKGPSALKQTASRSTPKPPTSISMPLHFGLPTAARTVSHRTSAARLQT